MYTLFILFVRPFSSQKDNLMEVINELFYVGFLIPLIIMKEEGDWSSKVEDFYYDFLFSNSVLISLITIIHLCKFEVI